MNLGKIFSGIGKGVGKVAGLAAPFLPGPWGAVAGVAGGLLGASDASRKSDNINNQLQGFSQEELENYRKYYPQLMQSYGDIANGTVNPYQTLADQLYSDQAIKGRADQVFDPSRLQNDYAKYWEQTEGGYNNAANAATADASRRGLGIGGGNTGLNSSLGQIRVAQGSDNTAFRRDLLTQLLNNKAQYVLGQGNQRAALLSQAPAAQERARGAQAGLTTGSAQGGIGILGGLSGLYGSRADNAAQGVTDLIGQASKSGVFNGVSKQVGGLLDRVFNRRRRPAGPLGTGGVYTPDPGGAAQTVGGVIPSYQRFM